MVQNMQEQLTQQSQQLKEHGLIPITNINNNVTNNTQNTEQYED